MKAKRINIEPLANAISRKKTEIVERKGIGHPDTLIDGIVENISRELCKEYLNVFGKILHHNVDKGQICGGATSVKYGGGEFIKPIYILLSGRATSSAAGKWVPAEEIAIKSTHEYLRKVCRFLDVEGDVIIDSRISQGSHDLVELFLRGPEIPLANDTSFGVGFAPLSTTEKMVIEVEKMLNSAEYKKKRPEVGEDVKVMAVREGESISLTVAIAFVSRFLNNLDDYIKSKEKVISDIEAVCKKYPDVEVSVAVNTADDYKNDSVYITLTGLSAEMGDDGSVGRGNRASGLITPCRPMTLEATAGKNPVNHVGKLYSILAFAIAERIAEIRGVEECNVSLLSQIGKPINEPKSVSVQVLSERPMSDFESRISDVVADELDKLPELTYKIVEGKAKVYY
ncbi:MAG: methionine adenosyltransferase [Candidatus Micrarchaeia archaeon]